MSLLHIPSIVQSQYTNGSFGGPIYGLPPPSYLDHSCYQTYHTYLHCVFRKPHLSTILYLFLVKNHKPQTKLHVYFLAPRSIHTYLPHRTIKTILTPDDQKLHLPLTAPTASKGKFEFQFSYFSLLSFPTPFTSDSLYCLTAHGKLHAFSNFQ